MAAGVDSLNVAVAGALAFARQRLTGGGAKRQAILLITDGQCDVVRVRREHAWLIPRGASLPFTARGPVFRVE